MVEFHTLTPGLDKHSETHSIIIVHFKVLYATINNLYIMGTDISKLYATREKIV